MVESKNIQTDCAELVLDEENILTVKLTPHYTLSLKDVAELAEKSKELREGRSVLVMAIIAEGSRLDSRAFKADLKKFQEGHVIAMGYVCTSAITRAILRIFIQLQRPTYPYKLFSSQQDARAWLKQHG